MKKLNTLMLISAMSMIFLACGDDDGGEAAGALSGDWRLTQVTANLDGTELTQISMGGLRASFTNDSFTYNNGGEQTGSWSINEEETEFSVSFENTTLVMPIVSKSDTEIVFTIKTIDLNNSTFSDEEKSLFLFINQTLIQSGNSWREASNGAQTATINFTLTKS